MARLSTLTKLAAAVFVAAAATVAFPVAPAQAAYCSGGAGVSVLVDYGSLGGGTATGCGGGASIASDAFNKAGFTLTPDQRQPGFVCQVKGKPADRHCMGTSAYWGFFVSDDGKGWAYASLGVYQQAVDSGDSVALVWQSSTKQRTPGTAPAPSTGGDESVPPSGKTTKRPRPKPTRSPAKPTSAPASTAASTTVTPSPTPTRSASAPTKARSKRPAPASPAATSSTPTPTLEATPTEIATPSASVDAATEPTSSDDDGGLPGWVAPGLVALLALAAGGVAWARRVR